MIIGYLDPQGVSLGAVAVLGPDLGVQGPRRGAVRGYVLSGFRA